MCRPGIRGAPSLGILPQHAIGRDHRRVGPQIGLKSPPGGSNPEQKLQKRVCQNLAILIVALQWVDVAKLEGREVVRICGTDGETTIADINDLAAALEAAR